MAGEDAAWNNNRVGVENVLKNIKSNVTLTNFDGAEGGVVIVKRVLDFHWMTHDGHATFTYAPMFAKYVKR